MTIAAQARRVQPQVSAEVAALAGLPAGPSLCAALAQIDVSAVSGYEMVLVLQARARQGNYERGQFLAAVAETMCRTDPEHGVLAEPDRDSPRKWNVAEVRAALMLTRTAAKSLAGLAHDLSRRLPAVLAAMVAGVIDQPRARVFSTWTERLADRHAREVVARLLPRAPRLTTGELIEAIQRAAIELDPRWARRRYEQALGLRRVKGTLRPDGTADLAGTNLPADQVAAACDRIDALAHRLKQAGYPSLLTWIRADIYLGKLDGRYEGLSDEQLFAHLMANPVPRPAPDPEPATPDDQLTDEEWDEYYDYLVQHGLIDPDEYDDLDTEDSRDGGDDGDDGDRETPQDDPGDDPNKDPGDEPPQPCGGPEPDGPDDDSSGGGLGLSTPDIVPADVTDPTDPPAAAGPAETHESSREVDAGTGQVRGKGLRLLVGLGTLAGLDRRPGELLGFGFVHAELARRVSATPAASWHYALVQPDGTPIQVGPIRRRPTGA